MLAIDFFDRQSGSKVWPSSDPLDSPYDKFKCKICGWTVPIRMNGSFPIEFDVNFYRDGILTQHLTLLHSVAKRQEYAKSKSGTFGRLVATPEEKPV